MILLLRFPVHKVSVHTGSSTELAIIHNRLDFWLPQLAGQWVLDRDRARTLWNAGKNKAGERVRDEAQGDEEIKDAMSDDNEQKKKQALDKQMLKDRIAHQKALGH